MNIIANAVRRAINSLPSRSLSVESSALVAWSEDERGRRQHAWVPADTLSALETDRKRLLLALDHVRNRVANQRILLLAKEREILDLKAHIARIERRDQR